MLRFVPILLDHSCAVAILASQVQAMIVLVRYDCLLKIIIPLYFFALHSFHYLSTVWNIS